MQETKAQKIKRLRKEIKAGRGKLAVFVEKREVAEQRLRKYITSRETELHSIGGTL